MFEIREQIGKAVEQLIEAVDVDDTINEISIKPDRLNYNTWVVSAKINDDRYFKYAVYVDSEGNAVTDGF